MGHRTRRLLGAVLAIAAVAAACGEPPPATTVSSSAGGAVIELAFAPAGIEGCDAIGVGFRSVTFVIDPEASEQVTARADTGEVLGTRWAPGFVGGPATERLVLDPAGQVVARDGEVLVIPEAAWPTLHGYRVCPGPDHLTILSVRG